MLACLQLLRMFVANLFRIRPPMTDMMTKGTIGARNGSRSHLGQRVGLTTNRLIRRSKERFVQSFRGTIHISLASSVISALRTLETGQFFSASPAIRANVAWSRFGTLARSDKAERVMRKPWPSGSRVTAASVLSSVGV